MDLSVLRGCHVDKYIHSTVHTVGERHEMMRLIAKTAARGESVAVVYPGKKEGAGSNTKKLHAVEEHMARWQRWFRDDVVCAHGGQKSEDNDWAIEQIRNGSAHILVATSIIEVGIDVEGMRRMVVVHPEQFGFSTLHQLRGRLARDGGEAFFNMLVVNEVTSKAWSRLHYIAENNDGFELAKHDLRERGGGDVTRSGHRQSGRMPDSPFPSETVDPDVFQTVWDELMTVYADGLPEQPLNNSR